MKLLDHIKATKYYLLNIDLSDQELFETRYAVFIKTRNGIDLERESEKSSLMEVLKTLPINSNVIISFSGNQVLTRFSSEIGNSLFEELDEEEFFLKRMASESGWMIQSACRRSIVNPIVDVISRSKLFLLDISFSPSSIPVLETQLEDMNLRIDHFQFEFKNHQIRQIQELSDPSDSTYKNETVSLGDNLFSPIGLDLLSALMLFSKERPMSLKSLGENASHSRFYRLFKKVGIITLSAVFFLLLTNFLLFNSLQRNLDRLQASNKSRTEKIKKIKGLQSQLAEYEKLVTNSTYSPQSTYSFYLDMIAEYRPTGVWFTSMEVNPASKKPDANKSILIDPSLIKISGEVNSPSNLNTFINTLKKQEWVNDIELKTYETSPEKSYADFRLDIRKQ